MLGSGWLKIFIFDGVIWYVSQIINGIYHPGGPRDKEQFDLYYAKLTIILFMLAAISFMRYMAT